jgi:hypothetical protein
MSPLPPMTTIFMIVSFIIELGRLSIDLGISNLPVVLAKTGKFIADSSGPLLGNGRSYGPLAR